MGATKLTNYTNHDLKLSRYGKIFAHPARIQILRGLLDNQIYRNLDLSISLNLSKTAVRNHVLKFCEAEIIDIQYFTHFYVIQLREEYVPMFRSFMDNFDSDTNL